MTGPLARVGVMERQTCSHHNLLTALDGDEGFKPQKSYLLIEYGYD
jgi:hypothetical protein